MTPAFTFGKVIPAMSLLATFSAKRRAIGRAMTCQGWTNKAKLGLLWDIAKEAQHRDGDVLEIGSAWGRSTVLLAHACSKTIWSIDPHVGGLIYQDRQEKQNSYQDLLNNLRRFNLQDQVRCLKATTQQVIDQQLMPQDQRLSMAFIDGLHTPEAVRVDWHFTQPRMTPGAIIVFDDYFEYTLPEYAAAIDELVAQHQGALRKDERANLAYVQL